MLLDASVPGRLRDAGIAVEAPWWTNRALLTGAGRAALRAVHEADVAAGADVVTAATFRCAERDLLDLGLAPGSGTAWMVHAAVGVARAAAGNSAEVIGSVGPGDPAGHGWLVTELARCGVDVVLAESMPGVAEAITVVEHATRAEAAVWVSFQCADDARLPSGESVVDGVLRAWERGAAVVLLNCGTPRQVEDALKAVRDRYDGPLGAYPDATGERLADALARWRLDYDLAVIGGCCGTTAADLMAPATRS
ncbi:homocysteine S-methyltransferase family protein [Actinokineospora cianjurensis]|uniref:S-methylmethionine-dependent homocysteine/selenocysteine methylase n=1 Tax=Actinokineospora cianjurensis TaxID=585224 RepID=A0A421B106_9PSEU|nr:homocysteine S-methyltransferase family protein [Actinokineospora cianjurensis]RLK58099.1 S-methylmethionine-dependent homocysteine/selenocysteine methylase [Actinokineospora cianjurensis]